LRHAILHYLRQVAFTFITYTLNISHILLGISIKYQKYHNDFRDIL
jgi:hypothetical protein